MKFVNLYEFIFTVPLILKKCVEVIEMHGIVTGVYRQCGIQSNIQKLRSFNFPRFFFFFYQSICIPSF